MGARSAALARPTRQLAGGGSSPTSAQKESAAAEEDLPRFLILRGPLGGARALGFAVTSGMRPDREAAVLADPEGAIKAYEDA